MEMKINCSILTPDRMLYEGQVHFAVVQAYDGEIGFLYNHAPFVSELGIGEIRLRTGSNTEFLGVEGGFVEIKENELVILAENAYKKEDLDKEELQKNLTSMDEREKATYEERLLVDVEVKKLKAKLKIASR